jgi:hypothetical protein
MVDDVAGAIRRMDGSGMIRAAAVSRDPKGSASESFRSVGCCEI